MYKAAVQLLYSHVLQTAYDCVRLSPQVDLFNKQKKCLVSHTYSCVPLYVVANILTSLALEVTWAEAYQFVFCGSVHCD
jgi:hypothetical protein